MSKTLEGKISYDLWDAYRKFANPHIELIATKLYEFGPLTLGELREQTEVTNSNLLNHELLEMRRVSIVKKEDKKYYLTKYGAVLLESLNEIRRKFSENPIEGNLNDLYKHKGNPNASSDNQSV